ncbi:extracellular solute-binding protein [Massilia sp. W12]|uniref:ABC transporter substrate-binding protein n=1 Tax=Massilia sp. W12 TaxID=3126507 RepID=UPI0030CD9861
MNKRRQIILAALAGAVIAAPAQAEQITLTVAAFPAVDQIVKAAVPAWKKLHPEIDIKVVSREYADHHNAMTLALATGNNHADVMAVELGFLGRFAEGGGLEDLYKAPYQAKNLVAKFEPWTIPQATSNSGELAAIPTDIGPGTLFYRHDIVSKAGVTAPDLTRSWDSFIEAGKRIKAATGVYLVAHARDITEIMIRSNLKDGEGIYFDKDNNVLVETPRFVHAFRLAKAAREAKIDAKINAWSNEWTESFKRGTVATQMMGAWLGGHLANTFAPAAKGLWRVADLPAGAYASWGGTFYAIPKKAKNKAAAWEFIKFMTLQKDNQIAAFKNHDAFPALVEAQSDAFFEQPLAYFGEQKARLIWREASRRTRAIDVNKYDPLAAEIINTELDKVLDQGKDVAQALADAKKLIVKRARR